MITTTLHRLAFAALSLAAAASAAIASADGPRVVDLPTRPGVTQRFLYIAPEHPVASAILFAGGHGGLKIADDGHIGWGARNFLVRTRTLFVDRGIAVAVVDAPSDLQGGNFLTGHRQSPEHLTDIKAVIGWLKQRSGVPVWLVGTSRGTQSAAFIATALSGKDGGPDGLVLTSTIVIDDKGRPIPKMPLDSLRIPVLVVHHERDACMVCPFDAAKSMVDALKNSPRKAFIAIDGGTSSGDACGAMAYHGFNGLDAPVVDRIADWIRG